MTFNKAQKAAQEIIDILLVERERLIIKAYQEGYNNIANKLKNLYLKIQAEGIPKDQYYNYMTQSTRLETLQKSILKDYRAATLRAKGIQLNTNRQVLTDAYYRKMYLYQWVKPADSVFVVMNDKVLETTINSNIDLWKRIPEAWGKGKDFVMPTGKTVSFYLAKGDIKTIELLTSTLNTAFVNGESYTKTAKGIQTILKGTRDHALLVAQTEGTRMYNAASLINTNIARSEGINIVRAWDAALDSKTRLTHSRADGKKEDKEGNFSVGTAKGPYPGMMSEGKENYRCRCSTIDLVDGVSPEVRRARNPVTGKTDIIGYRDFDTWAKDNKLKWTNKGWKIV